MTLPMVRAESVPVAHRPSAGQRGAMSTITVTSRGHSCITFQRDGATLVIDPGAFSDPAALDGADAVLITHEHWDHLQVEPLVAALGAGAELQVWAPQDVVTKLGEAGADTGRVHAATPGESFEAAGFHVQALGGRHATIHPDMTPLANVAYLVEGAVLHPGDSLTPPPDGVALRVLLAPVSAPWLKLSEAIDYVRAVAAPLTVPIHDAILSDVGKDVVDGMMGGGFAGATEYRRLAPGEPLEVAAT